MNCWVILVNYNGKDVNEDCINSILSSETDLNLKIVVVDNQSTDGSLVEIRKRHKDVKVIELGYNSGFAYANNIAMKEACESGVDYVFLLNNDTVIETDTVQKLYQSSIDNPMSVIVPRIMYYGDKNVIWYAGGYFDKSLFNNKHKFDGCKYSEVECEECDTEFATGCSMFFTTEILRVVGFMPEEYFLYYEDAAYSKIIREKGIRIHFVPDAVVYHKVSVTTGGSESTVGVYYGTRNRMHFMKTYYADIYKRFLVYFFASRIIYSIKWVVQGRINIASACWKGIRDYLAGKMGKCDEVS